MTFQTEDLVSSFRVNPSSAVVLVVGSRHSSHFWPVDNLFASKEALATNYVANIHNQRSHVPHSSQTAEREPPSAHDAFPSAS